MEKLLERSGISFPADNGTFEEHVFRHQETLQRDDGTRRNLRSSQGRKG
jgi:hypothetical protein